MLNIRFEAQGEEYRRIITFPAGNISEDLISIPPQWHTVEPYPWIRPLHEYDRPELEAKGEAIAALLFGEEGIRFITESTSGSAPLHIVIQENCQSPEIARVPWETAFVDGRFLATDRYTPILRRPSHLRPVGRITIHSPLRMVLLSASPKDQGSLMVEEELLTIALSLDEPMASGRLIVDEVMNCTREKLKETLRANRYDIVYFTGHGALQDNTGFLCLEKADGTTDLVSAEDFANDLRSQRGIGLLFLNCCDAASVDTTRNESWKGFGDVARKAMKQAAPQVIATQSAIFDHTGRKVMKSFFTELCRDGHFDVATALAMARGDVENDQSQFHDFYHFVHLSLLKKGASLEVVKAEADESGRDDWQHNVVFHTSNRMDIGKGFVGRFSFISRIEEAWWNDGVKVVGIHGLGGIGKTFLCGRMEQRALTHHLLARRPNKSIWIDFRDGTGSTVAGFLQQLEGIARDFGFQAFNKVLDDHENFPTPLEKLRPWLAHLDKQCQGKALLILDNLESALDAEGDFVDPELRAWFVELLARSPSSWKLLVTCRHQFDFFPDGRQLATARWLHLTEMGATERLALINRDIELRQRPEAEKREILKCAGGHPYIINLVAKYLRTHPALPEALRRAAEQTAEYAQLDWVLSLLSPDELDWLLIAALFPSPRHDSLIVMTKMIRNEGQDVEGLEATFHAAMRRLVELSLAESSDGEIQIHPLLVWQLLENPASSYRQPEELVAATLRAIAIVFLNIVQSRSRPEKAMLLLQGVDAALEQSDRDLLKVYLQECAQVFHGFVPASIFADIVCRAEETLLEEADESIFLSLCCCAQTLCEMRHFSASTNTLTKIMKNARLTDGEKGMVLTVLGTVCLTQRNWPHALVHFQGALKWTERTGQQHGPASIWHQIGRVYEEQRNWSQAMESYQKSLEWNEKTGHYHQLGLTWRQIGSVYAKQHNWHQALVSYQKAMECDEKTRQHHQLGLTWHQIGRVYEEQRNWSQALESYQKAMEWGEKTGQHYYLGGAWHHIGIMYHEQRNWPQALESYQKALEWHEKTGRHHQIGGAWHQIGKVYEEQGNWLQALESYQKALEWNEKTSEYHHLGRTWHQIGMVYAEQRNWPQALESYQKALEWNEKSSQNHLLGGSWHQIGRVYEEQQNFSESLRCYLHVLEYLAGTSEEKVKILLASLRRIFPHLSPEEQAGIEDALPEALYTLLARAEE